MDNICPALGNLSVTERLLRSLKYETTGPLALQVIGISMTELAMESLAMSTQVAIVVVSIRLQAMSKWCRRILHAAIGDSFAVF
jgi:DUF1365 family protein